MKQHRPRMSNNDYNTYKQLTHSYGSLSAAIWYKERIINGNAIENRRLSKENATLRRAHKLAPLLVITGVVIGLLIGCLVWGV